MVLSVTVYRFEYLDRTTNSRAVAPDFATPEAIRSMGGAVLLETAQEVPASEITFSGIWRPFKPAP